MVTPGHSGSYSARLGASSAFNGDSTITQTVSVPASARTLTFWYQPHCPDTLTYDQIQMRFKSTAGATLSTPLNVCTNTGAWTTKTYTIPTSIRGTTVVLWFNVHDDGYPTDPTWALFDDIAIN